MVDKKESGSSGLSLKDIKRRFEGPKPVPERDPKVAERKAEEFNTEVTEMFPGEPGTPEGE